MYWLLIPLLLAMISGVIYGFTAAMLSKNKKGRAIRDFNAAAGDLRSAQESLDEYMEKAEEILRTVRAKDVTDPDLLKRLRFALAGVKKSAGPPPPKMKSDLYEIRTQTQNMGNQASSLWKLYAEIVDAIFLVTESQKEAARTGQLIVALSVVHPVMGVGFPVFALNPETGGERLIASFHISNASYNNFQTDSTLFLPVASEPRREWFSGDFSKMAVTKVFNQTNEYHAGWIDTSGNFFDVTEALGLQSKDEEDPPASYHATGFAGGLFGYYQGAPSENDSFYLPVDDISASAVQRGDVRCAGRPYDQDGSLTSGQDAEKIYPHQVTSWIDETRCIANNQEDSSVIVDTKSKASAKYLPGGARTAWNGVISPSKEKIAFMSQPNGSKEKTSETIDIYIAPVNGGRPEKADVYSDFVKGVGHTYMYDPSWESLFYWTLIDWC